MVFDRLETKQRNTTQNIRMFDNVKLNQAHVIGRSCARFLETKHSSMIGQHRNPVESYGRQCPVRLLRNVLVCV